MRVSVKCARDCAELLLARGVPNLKFYQILRLDEQSVFAEVRANCYLVFCSGLVRHQSVQQTGLSDTRVPNYYKFEDERLTLINQPLKLVTG